MEAADTSLDKFLDIRQRTVSRTVACQVAIQMARGSFRTLLSQSNFAQSLSYAVASGMVAESNIDLRAVLVFLATYVRFCTALVRDTTRFHCRASLPMYRFGILAFQSHHPPRREASEHADVLRRCPE